MFTSLSQVLALASAAVLVGVIGGAWGGSSRLSAAEPEKPPVEVAGTASCEFGMDLYRQLVRQSPDKNLFFSPYSMSSALVMAAEGARGKTAEEMGKVLHFPAAARRTGSDAKQLPWNTAMVLSATAELNRQLISKNKAPRLDQYELRIANGLWGDESSPFHREFLDALQSKYAIGQVALMNFRNAPDAARQQINLWCQQETNGRIAGALPPGSINSMTRLVLANAIYFFGQWSDPFDPKQTQDRDFTLSTKEVVRVPMMHKSEVKKAYGAFNADGSLFNTPDFYDPQTPTQQLYPDDRGFLAADLSYKGGRISMTVLVPRSPDGLGNLEALLTSDRLQEWLGQMKERKIHVFLPKFKLETSYEMSKQLATLGMPRAFELGRADFSGISTGDGPLFLSAVIHKAFVEVNEKGTEAAAFTGIAMLGAARPSALRPFIPEFKAERPFLFLIRDGQSGALLFIGRVTNPNAK